MTPPFDLGKYVRVTDTVLWTFFQNSTFNEITFEALLCNRITADGDDLYKGETLQYLGLSKLSLQELQGFSVPLLTILQGGQLLLHLPL